MQQRTNLKPLIMAIVIALVLTLLMVVVGAQAQIVFVSNRDGHFRNDIPGLPRLSAYEIYVMDTDGGNQRRLTNDPANDYAPSWSPDGRRIAFVSDRDGHVNERGSPLPEIYVMNADGGNQQNLTNHPSDDRSPSWSPDGKRIVFQSDREGRFNDDIYVMDADGGNLQILTDNRNDDEDPSWSPDGERIAFSSSREGHVEDKFGITDEIYVMDADGGNQRRLTDNRNNDWYPVWSPDNQRIAFASDRKGDFVSFDIYVMDADGGNQQKLTNHRAWDSSPSWSPDSQRIVFNSNREGKSDIYVMDAAGGNLQNLTNNPHGDGSPAWLNSPFSVSPAGKEFIMWGRLKGVSR